MGRQSMLQIVALTAIQTPVAVDTFVFILATALPNQRGSTQAAHLRMLALVNEGDSLPTASTHRKGHFRSSGTYRVRTKNTLNTDTVSHDLPAGAPPASWTPFAPFLIDQDR